MNPDLNIRCGWLIDGTGGEHKKDVLIKIKNGLIQSIEHFDEIKADNDILDLRSWTILPGLMDCHVHLAWSGTTDPAVRQAQFDQGFNAAKKKIKKNLENSLSSGVLFVRDGGDRNGYALKYKNEIHNSETIRMACAGRGLYKPGRYGRLIGIEIKSCDDLIDIIKNTAGIDHVKIVNSGLNSLTEFGKPTPPQFSREELETAVKTAKAMGISVMVHANGEIPVRMAIEAGCSSIEHGFFMGKDNLKRMADHNTFWIPTAFTMKAYSEQLDRGSNESEIAKKNLDHQLEQISLAREYGTPLALGTDAGGMGVEHGKSAAMEMALYMEAGYTVSEVIECATKRAALLLGLPDTGTLFPGKRADLIAVPSTPDKLINSLESEIRVFIKGKESIIQQHAGPV